MPIEVSEYKSAYKTELKKFVPLFVKAANSKAKTAKTAKDASALNLLNNVKNIFNDPKLNQESEGDKYDLIYTIIQGEPQGTEVLTLFSDSFKDDLRSNYPNHQGNLDIFEKMISHRNSRQQNTSSQTFPTNDSQQKKGQRLKDKPSEEYVEPGDFGGDGIIFSDENSENSQVSRHSLGSFNISTDVVAQTQALCSSINVLNHLDFDRLNSGSKRDLSRKSVLLLGAIEGKGNQDTAYQIYSDIKGVLETNIQSQHRLSFLKECIDSSAANLSADPLPGHFCNKVISDVKRTMNFSTLEDSVEAIFIQNMYDIAVQDDGDVAKRNDKSADMIMTEFCSPNNIGALADSITIAEGDIEVVNRMDKSALAKILRKIQDNGDLLDSINSLTLEESYDRNIDANYAQQRIKPATFLNDHNIDTISGNIITINRQRIRENIQEALKNYVKDCSSHQYGDHSTIQQILKEIKDHASLLGEDNIYDIIKHSLHDEDISQEGLAYFQGIVFQTLNAQEENTVYENILLKAISDEKRTKDTKSVECIIRQNIHDIASQQQGDEFVRNALSGQEIVETFQSDDNIALLSSTMALHNATGQVSGLSITNALLEVVNGFAYSKQGVIDKSLLIQDVAFINEERNNEMPQLISNKVRQVAPLVEIAQGLVKDYPNESLLNLQTFFIDDVKERKLGVPNVDDIKFVVKEVGNVELSQAADFALAVIKDIEDEISTIITDHIVEMGCNTQVSGALSYNSDNFVAAVGATSSVVELSNKIKRQYGNVELDGLVKSMRRVLTQQESLDALEETLSHDDEDSVETVPFNIIQSPADQYYEDESGSQDTLSHGDIDIITEGEIPQMRKVINRVNEKRTSLGFESHDLLEIDQIYAGISDQDHLLGPVSVEVSSRDNYDKSIETDILRNEGRLVAHIIDNKIAEGISRSSIIDSLEKAIIPDSLKKRNVVSDVAQQDVLKDIIKSAQRLNTLGSSFEETDEIFNREIFDHVIDSSIINLTSIAIRQPLSVKNHDIESAKDEIRETLGRTTLRVTPEQLKKAVDIVLSKEEITPPQSYLKTIDEIVSQGVAMQHPVGKHYVFDDVEDIQYLINRIEDACNSGISEFKIVENIKDILPKDEEELKTFLHLRSQCESGPEQELIGAAICKAKQSHRGSEEVERNNRIASYIANIALLVKQENVAGYKQFLGRKIDNAITAGVDIALIVENIDSVTKGSEPEQSEKDFCRIIDNVSDQNKKSLLDSYRGTKHNHELGKVKNNLHTVVEGSVNSFLDKGFEEYTKEENEELKRWLQLLENYIGKNTGILNIGNTDPGFIYGEVSKVFKDSNISQGKIKDFISVIDEEYDIDEKNLRIIKKAAIDIIRQRNPESIESIIMQNIHSIAQNEPGDIERLKADFSGPKNIAKLSKTLLENGHTFISQENPSSVLADVFEELITSYQLIEIVNSTRFNRSGEQMNGFSVFQQDALDTIDPGQLSSAIVDAQRFQDLGKIVEEFQDVSNPDAILAQEDAFIDKIRERKIEVPNRQHIIFAVEAYGDVRTNVEEFAENVHDKIQQEISDIIKDHIVELGCKTEFSGVLSYKEEELADVLFSVPSIASLAGKIAKQYGPISTENLIEAMSLKISDQQTDGEYDIERELMLASAVKTINDRRKALGFGDLDLLREVRTQDNVTRPLAGTLVEEMGVIEPDSQFKKDVEDNIKSINTAPKNRDNIEDSVNELCKMLVKALQDNVNKQSIITILEDNIVDSFKKVRTEFSSQDFSRKFAVEQQVQLLANIRSSLDENVDAQLIGIVNHVQDSSKLKLAALALEGSISRAVTTHRGNLQSNPQEHILGITNNIKDSLQSVGLSVTSEQLLKSIDSILEDKGYSPKDRKKLATSETYLSAIDHITSKTLNLQNELPIGNAIVFENQEDYDRLAFKILKANDESVSDYKIVKNVRSILPQDQTEWDAFIENRRRVESIFDDFQGRYVQDIIGAAISQETQARAQETNRKTDPKALDKRFAQYITDIASDIVKSDEQYKAGISNHFVQTIHTALEKQCDQLLIYKQLKTVIDPNNEGKTVIDFLQESAPTLDLQSSYHKPIRDFSKRHELYEKANTVISAQIKDHNAWPIDSQSTQDRSRANKVIGNIPHVISAISSIQDVEAQHIDYLLKNVSLETLGRDIFSVSATSRNMSHHARISPEPTIDEPGAVSTNMVKLPLIMHQHQIIAHTQYCADQFKEDGNEVNAANLKNALENARDVDLSADEQSVFDQKISKALQTLIPDFEHVADVEQIKLRFLDVHGDLYDSEIEYSSDETIRDETISQLWHAAIEGDNLKEYIENKISEVVGNIMTTEDAKLNVSNLSKLSALSKYKDPLDENIYAAIKKGLKGQNLGNLPNVLDALDQPEDKRLKNIFFKAAQDVKRENDPQSVACIFMQNIYDIARCDDSNNISNIISAIKRPHNIERISQAIYSSTSRNITQQELSYSLQSLITNHDLIDVINSTRYDKMGQEIAGKSIFDKNVLARLNNNNTLSDEIFDNLQKKFLSHQVKTGLGYVGGGLLSGAKSGAKGLGYTVAGVSVAGVAVAGVAAGTAISGAAYTVAAGAAIAKTALVSLGYPIYEGAKFLHDKAFSDKSATTSTKTSHVSEYNSPDYGAKTYMISHNSSDSKASKNMKIDEYLEYMGVTKDTGASQKLRPEEIGQSLDTLMPKRKEQTSVVDIDEYLRSYGFGSSLETEISSEKSVNKRQSVSQGKDSDARNLDEYMTQFGFDTPQDEISAMPDISKSKPNTSPANPNAMTINQYLESFGFYQVGSR